MRILIRLSAKEELKALPIILRQAPGMILPERTYLITAEVAQALRDARVEFTELGSEVDAPNLQEAVPGERI